MATPRKTNRGPVAGPENRAALIAAARTVFDERGIDAPLSAVAKLAGVGQGSLYRHFPDRVSLAVAVFAQNMEAIEALAADETTTLRDLLDLITHQAEGASAFIEILSVHGADARVAGLSDELAAILATKWEQAVAAGLVDSSSDVRDLQLAISMVALAVGHAPRDQRHAMAESAWRILAPGLGLR